MKPVTSSASGPQRVLVVDDDPMVSGAVCAALRAAGFVCAEVASADRARRAILRSRPDLVVLDLGLPDLDGLDLLRDLRATDDLPIIVLSGRDSETDRVMGLDIGADDYITKPFSPRELTSRAKSVLRRAKSAPTTGVVSFGDITVDIDAREVIKAGAMVSLTLKEFDLLVFLARHPRTVFTREALLKSVWQHVSSERSEATVTEHMRRLRLKLEADPGNPQHLVAVRGVGYRLLP